MSYNSFEDYQPNNKNNFKKKKSKGHKHRKHYDYNDDFQKNKQFKLRKKHMDEKYLDDLDEDERGV